MRELSAELLANPGAKVGECPLPDGTDYLLWVDIPEGRVWRTDIATGRCQQYGKVDGSIGAICHRAQGGLLLASEQGFYALAAEGAAAELLETAVTDPGQRLNDGKVDPWGRFVAGTACSDGRQTRASLLALKEDFQIDTLLRDVTMSNGLDWSPDNRLFYYVDTPKGCVERFTVDPENGTLASREVFTEIEPGLGLPDGLCVDEDGCVWLAVWDGSCVLGYTPAGHQFARIKIPTSRPTSCIFGGSDRQTLFITTAQNDDDVDTWSGGLFAVRLPVPGQPIRAFLG